MNMTAPRRRPKLTIGETFAFRDVLLEQVHATRPRLPSELSVRLQHEWGSFTQRSLYRALLWLVSRGKIERVGVRMACVDGGYVRTAHGGAETAEDLEARRRIDLAGEHRCYRCARKIRRRKPYHGRYCRVCYRVDASAREREHYARSRARRAVAQDMAVAA